MIIPERAQLPPELLELSQFILWFEKKIKDKTTKVPCAPGKTGHWGAASATDPGNWTDFDTALEYAKKREGYEVGFCFKEGGRIVGIDLDHCINEYGEVNSFARKIIRKAGSYAELSPSGKGIHILLKGELPGAIRSKERGVEAYDRERFFTLTGRRCKETPLAINENNELLSELWEKYGEKTIKPVILDKSTEGKIPITKVVPLAGLKRRGKQYQGCHPVHGSDTGMNFAINSEKNTWFCYRHWVGGGPLSWFAVQSNILECEEVKDKRLVKRKWKQILNLARQQGLIPEEVGGREEGETVIATSFLEQPDFIAEEVYDNGHEPKFAVWDGKQVKYVPEIQVGKITYVPIFNDALKQGAVLLPTAAEAFESIEKLVGEVKALIHAYEEVSPAFEQFAAWYVLLTWVYDRINTLPYLRHMGGLATGKSRSLNVEGRVCYKPVFAAGAVTAAPIYRMIRQWGGTLIIDEADWRRSDEKDEVVTILNCGFERGRPVLRCTKDNPDEVQILPVFGPKILATRKPFYDAALDSRCLTEVMQPKTRKDIPVLLPREFYENAAKLRNKLLMFRFEYRSRVNTDAAFNIDLGDIEDRIKQTTISFATLFANMPEMIEQFKRFLKRYQREVVKTRADTWEGMVVDAIFAIRSNPQEDVSARDIVKYLKEARGEKDPKPQRVGRTLTGLKIEREQKRVGEHVLQVIKWNKQWMRELGLKYIPDLDKAYPDIKEGEDVGGVETKVKFLTDINTGDESQPNLPILERLLGKDKRFSKGKAYKIDTGAVEQLVMWGYCEVVSDA